MEDVDVEALAESVKALDARGASDDEIAAWLKERTTTFAESGTALAIARQLPKAEAYSLLHDTETWRAATRWYRLTTSAGLAAGSLGSPSGRTYSVGETVNLAMAPEPPHAGEAGRGTIWRIVAIEPGDEPGFSGTLIVEPVRRFEPREQ